MCVNIKKKIKEKKNSIHSTIDKKLCEHKVPFLWVIDKNLRQTFFLKNSRPSANGQKIFVPSWTSSSPDLCRCTLPTTLLLQGRSGPVQYRPSLLRPSVHHPNKLTTFSPHFPFFLFRQPPKGTDPRQQKHTTWTKSSSSKEGRNCPRNYYYFYAYGLSVCMDGQIFLLWCVGGWGWC